RVFDLACPVEMTVVVGRNADAVASAAAKWGWAESATDWREVIARDDIDIVDIVTPGDSHAEIAIAALEAGKHVLCEKPLANTVAE
ncbi:Gfo/Idh/MocA family oxidoreductase, partial [Escherichia coli]|uniref:Gfo/Idh/MocA family oxidoreductase n=2 Tax=Bacteria TaxID=2 RepID=UPI003CE51465